MRHRTDLAWDRLGSQDPYYGVLADPKFRGRSLDNGVRAEFFRSGERHVEEVMATIRRTVAPDFNPVSTLDFGCGVGRVLIPLARRCRQAVGVDVSVAMLLEARSNCQDAGVDAQLLNSEDMGSLDRTFDLVHSMIVFQHIPVRRGIRFVDTLLPLVAPGGVGVLHFTYASSESHIRRALRWSRTTFLPIHYATNIVRGRPALQPSMQMNRYDLGAIFKRLQRLGCTSTYAEFTKHGPFAGVVLYFRRPEGQASQI